MGSPHRKLFTWAVKEAESCVYPWAAVNKCVLSLLSHARISQAQVQTQQPGSKHREDQRVIVSQQLPAARSQCAQEAEVRTCSRASGGVWEEILLFGYSLEESNDILGCLRNEHLEGLSHPQA